MVEIGEKPILWHIMKIYSAYGVSDFIICCGYKGHVIKEYFANYVLHKSEVTFDLQNQDVTFHRNGVEPWKVTLVDTGASTMTGGRLKRVREYLDDETFFLTYGDGLADVNISEQLRFHREQGGVATLLAVQPPGRFGAFSLDSSAHKIDHFREKPNGDNAWINGGFFILEPRVLEYIKGDSTVFEREPLEGIASDGWLVAYKHTGFWQPMDTLRDKTLLEDLWRSDNPPWKIW